jgi:putative ABC transport system permease protein
MDHLRDDLRYAFRQIRANPAFTAIVVLVLAVGVGGAVGVFSYFYGLTHLPAPGVAPDSRLVSVEIAADPVHETSNRRFPRSISLRTLTLLRERSNHFVTLAGYSSGSMLSVDVGTNARMMSVVGVTESYFRTLNLRPLLGAFFAHPDSDPTEERVAVISERLWRNELDAAPDVVGRSIRVDGVPLTIVGVAPERFGGVKQQHFNVWVPIVFVANARAKRGYGTAGEVSVRGLIAKLRPGVRPEIAAQNLLPAVSVLVPPDGEFGEATTEVKPIRMFDGDLFDFKNDTSMTLVLLVILAASVLLLVITNASALLIGRAVNRQKEIVVRLSLGASRSRIQRQLLTESAVLGLLAGTVSVVVLYLARDYLLSATADTLPVFLPLDWATAAGAFAIALGTGLIFGHAPALHASVSSLATVLKDAGAGGGGPSRSKLHRRLMVTQLAISQPFLILTTLGLGMIVANRPWDYGAASVDRVLAIHVQQWSAPGADQSFNRIRDWLRDQPGVGAVTVTQSVSLAFPPNGSSVNYYKPVDGPRSGFWRWDVDKRSVDLNYFEAIGIPLIGGRVFAAADTGPDSRTVLVTETTARLFWPGESALGKRLLKGALGSRDSRARAVEAVVEVVGVVGDIVENAVQPDRRPVIYTPRRSARCGGGCVLLARTTGPASALIVPAQQAIRRLGPDLPPPEVTTLEAAYDKQITLAVGLAAAASSFAILALILASIGLAGIIGFSVANRTKEIGIRLALGAGRRRVVALFLRQGLVTVALGVAFGLPFTVALFLPLATEVKAGAGVLIGSGLAAELVLLCVAVFASWVPARLAARVDPMVALRAE